VGPQTYIRTFDGSIGTKSSFFRVFELVRRIVTMSVPQGTRQSRAGWLFNPLGNDEAPAPVGQRVMQQMRMLRNVVMALA
jgi:hypothetical protein